MRALLNQIKTRVRNAVAIVVAALFTPDLWRRAAKTAAQTFTGLLVVPVFANFNIAAWKDALLAAGIGTVAVVWNAVFVPAFSALRAKVVAVLFGVTGSTPHQLVP